MGFPRRGWRWAATCATRSSAGPPVILCGWEMRKVGLAPPYGGETGQAPHKPIKLANEEEICNEELVSAFPPHTRHFFHRVFSLTFAHFFGLFVQFFSPPVLSFLLDLDLRIILFRISGHIRKILLIYPPKGTPPPRSAGEAIGRDLAHAVFTFVPNAGEISFLGLVEVCGGMRIMFPKLSSLSTRK